MDFKKTVAIHYTEFTPSERKICARILEDPQIVNNSIVVLGDLCETSKSAILRFYQKLGYRGYSEFKYSVEESFKNTLREAHKTYVERVEEGADPNKTMEELLDVSLKSFKKQLQ